MRAFVCEVCLEERSDRERFRLSQLKTAHGEVLRAADCGHAVCQDCMASYILTRIEEHRVSSICCPGVSCRSEIYGDDLHRLAERGALAASHCDRFTEFRARDYTARAKDFAEVTERCAKTPADYAVLRQLWETTRLCPRCKVVIEKKKGCDSFHCICGHRFSYRTAPRVFGINMKGYSKVIRIAQNLRVPIREAEVFRDDLKLSCKASRTAAHFEISMAEAIELHNNALRGDELARECIQEARRASRAAGGGYAPIPGSPRRRCN